MKKDKVLGIVLLVVVVFMTILGIANSEVVDEFNIYWMSAVAGFVPGVLLLTGRREAAIKFSRIIIGSVFIVSGLIKANDTVGFGIKLEEYFDENALGSFWAIFHPVSLPIAFFVSGIEVLLGLALLFGARARLVSVVLLGMTIFFGWLTYFTASCNESQMAAIAAGEAFDKVCVTDCGCFGDALRGSVGRSLTPWESFYKDLGLFLMTLVVVFFSGSIKVNSFRDNLIILPASILITVLFGGWLFGWMFPTYFLLVASIVFFILKQIGLKEAKLEWTLAAVLAIMTYGFAYYTYSHLPMIDYRPYAVGENIKDQMKSAEELGLEPTEYANIYRLKNSETGEEMTINSKEYLEKEIWKNKAWSIEYTSPEPIVISRGYEAPIASFNVMNEDNTDIGEDLLNDENFSFMVVAYDVSKAEGGETAKKLKKLSEEAQNKGYHFYAVTSSPYDVYEDYRHENQLAFPFYTADEIFLKTIVRSNPGLLLLKNGKIMAKWHANDIPPSLESIEEMN
jgi:uncharacterized membrane protein YphA (DoxX/SURF4 family)